MKNVAQISSLEHDEELGAKKVTVVGGSMPPCPTTKNSGEFVFTDTSPKQFSSISVPYVGLILVPVAANGVSSPVGTFKWGYSSETCVKPFTDYLKITGEFAGNFNELWFAASNATDKLLWDSAHVA